MTPLEFERRYAPVWTQLEQALEKLAGKKVAGAATAAAIVPLYRQACHHLALARDRSYPSYLVVRLNRLVHATHQVLYRPRTRIWSQVLHFAAAGFPALVRANAGCMAIAAAAFVLPLVVIGLLVYFQPELVYAVFDAGQVTSFERMYNPAAGKLGRERGADSDIVMFGFYIRNNIGISFQVFASGLLLGVGSLFYLVINGAFIGAAAGYLTQIGYGAPFWNFVSGHSAFELTAIVISGGAGIKLGLALLAPGQLTRRQALLAAAADAVKIIYGVAAMLLIAAFIEAFWSSMRWLPDATKYGVAGMLWFGVAYYFLVQGRLRA